jgi:8-oxo-dGTP pyrophosphatase MutT (NUDIX family)
VEQFERIGSELVWQGRIAGVRVDEFRYPDGEIAQREIVSHPGAVAIVAHDERQLYFVRQPREPVGEQQLLELPAGKLDVPGEDPLETAKRELVEEIGKAAAHWRELKRFYTSPGFADEQVIVYLATGLSAANSGEPDENERIEVVQVALADLDSAIGKCRDAKSLIGLLMFRELRQAGEA